MRFTISLVFVLLFSGAASAQSSWVTVNGKQQTVSWFEFVGQTVECEGLVWGAYVKGLGPYVIFPRNPAFEGRLYLTNCGAIQEKIHGRLVYLKGVLRQGKKHKAESTAEFPVQGYSHDFMYYYLEVTHWKFVDKLTDQQLLPVSSKR